MDEVTPERWLPVNGYEGFYEVSDLGGVRGRRRTGSKGGPLKPRSTRFGHLFVTLCAIDVGYEPRQEYVHRLVAAAFIGPCPEDMEVRHLNGNPGDNRLANLAYGTHAENMQDMMQHGTSYWSKQTHCSNNHEFTPENTRIACHPDGSFKQRVCRACVNEDGKRRRRARRNGASLTDHAIDEGVVA